jgi:hypothetical protein
MIPRILRVSLLVGLVLGQGCTWHRGQGWSILPGHYGERTTADRERQRIPFGPKPVVGKEKPSRLLARDGTSCVVSPKKYESTILGTTVWCGWMQTDR